MQKRKGSGKKKSQSNFAKLSLFQPNKYKFKKACPLSIKGAPKKIANPTKITKQKYGAINASVGLSTISCLSIYLSIYLYHL